MVIELRWWLRKLAVVVTVSLVVATICFWCIHALPGDLALQVAAARYVDRAPDAELADVTRIHLGLEKPILYQYGRWIWDLVTLDFGRSLVTDRAVISELAPYFGNTARLGALTLAGALLIALPMGVLAALLQNTLLQRFADLWSAIFSSVPVFLVGALAIELFVVNWKWASLSGQNEVVSLLLPAGVAAVAVSAPLVQVVRNSARAVVTAPYFNYARMRGVPMHLVIRNHLVRNATPPVLAYFSTLFVFVVYDLVVVEIVFNYPGLGSALLDALKARDVPVVQCAVLGLVSMYLAVTTLSDYAAMRLDRVPNQK